MSLEEKIKKKEILVGQERLDRLAQPKDILKTGKELLNLKKMHPKDPILTKMILAEFSNECKLVKYANEYDNFDSDEEELVMGT